jgi:WD40 repeat protein
VWDVETGQKRLEVKVQYSVAESCAWSPDGTRLLSGDSEGNLCVWDAETGQKRLEVKAQGSVESCAWSPDGTRLLSGDERGNLLVWDAKTGQKRLEVKTQGSAWSCAWSPDGTRLLSGDEGGNLCVWDAQTGQKLREIFPRPESEIAWEPATGKIIHASGLFWRDFYWEATLPGDRKELYPIEVFGRLDAASQAAPEFPQ